MAKITTAEEALVAVRKNGMALKNVPWGQLNLTVPEKTELCLETLKRTSSAFQYIPENLKTAELYLEAVKQAGYLLQYKQDNDIQHVFLRGL